MALPEFQVLRPHSIDEAVDLLARYAPNAQILAGGTDLVPSLKQQLFAPRHLIDLGNIRELRAIVLADGGLHIGAMTTLSHIERSRDIAELYPVLHEAARTVASPVLRNMGTIGGNICLDTRCLWYNQSLAWRKSCGFCIKKDGDLCHVAPGGTKCWAAFSADTPPALLCLEAELEVASVRGTRRIFLRDFYTNDGADRMKLAKDELLTRVIFPARTSGWRGAYRKLRVRGSIDYPLAGVAVTLPRNGRIEARVAITGVNPSPMLVWDWLPSTGTADLDAIASMAGDAAARTAKPLTTSALTPEYRREMVRVFTRRALLAAAND